MTSTNQHEETSLSFDPDLGDGRQRKKSAADSQKSTSRRLASFKDKVKDRVFASKSGINDNSDSEAKTDLPPGGQSNLTKIESSTAVKEDQVEAQAQQQKLQRANPKSVPIVLKSDVQRELKMVMDDPPPVPAKNHARPQVQHKMDNKRELRTSNYPGQDRRLDVLQAAIVELQEELRKAKEDALRAEEDALKERQGRQDLKAQLEDLISQDEDHNHDSNQLSQQNLLLSKELSRAHESLNRDQAYQTLISERRAWEQVEKILKSKINLQRQDMLTIQAEGKKLIKEYKTDVNEARAELQRRIKEYDDKLAQVQEQRDQVINERDRVRKELDRVVQQQASQVSLDVYYFDDNYFQSQFSILRGNIKDWAHRAFSNGQFTSDRRINLVATKVFDSLTTNWESYIYSDEHRSTIVQAFVWTYLIAKIFGGRTWESSASTQPFGRLLEKYLEPNEHSLENLQLYHEWRSTGARLAIPRGTEQSALDSSSTHLKAIADTLQNYLEPWSTMGKTQSVSMLYKIIKEAVQLDVKMQQQRASFLLWGSSELRRQNSGDGGRLLYEPKAMEVRFGKEGGGGRREKERLVEVVIAPLLFKRGTADGRDYLVEVVVEKAQVDIAVPPKKSKGLLNIVR